MLTFLTFSPFPTIAFGLCLTSIVQCPMISTAITVREVFQLCFKGFPNLYHQLGTRGMYLGAKKTIFPNMCHGI